MSSTIVVTPTYCTPDNERLSLLLQSIYWVQQQSSDITHVIVDDGSTDETPELLEIIADTHDNILVFHQANQGSSAAVNFGIEQALKVVNPDYITISHSDDLLPPTSIEARVKRAKETGTEFVYTNMLKFGDQFISKLVLAPDFPDAKTLYCVLCTHQSITNPTMLWSRDLYLEIGGYDPRITSGEDLDIALRTAKRLSETGKRFSTLHQATAAYRVHGQNLGDSNVRNGTAMKCLKMVYGKHLQTPQYQLRLIAEATHQLRALLPEPVTVALRRLKHLVLSPPAPAQPYEHTFLDMIEKVDYQAEFKH